METLRQDFKLYIGRKFMYPKSQFVTVDFLNFCQRVVKDNINGKRPAIMVKSLQRPVVIRVIKWRRDTASKKI